MRAGAIPNVEGRFNWPTKKLSYVKIRGVKDSSLNTDRVHTDHETEQLPSRKICRETTKNLPPLQNYNQLTAFTMGTQKNNMLPVMFS